jgi:hypothetical protein
MKFILLENLSIVSLPNFILSASEKYAPYLLLYRIVGFETHQFETDWEKFQLYH